MPQEMQGSEESPHETLTRLMEQYEPALWRLVKSYVTDRASREDLFQEIALGIWKAIPHYRGQASERTWLYRIAHNIAISTLYSRRRRERSEVPMPQAAEWHNWAQRPDEAIQEIEKREAMIVAIRELSAIDRQVVMLRMEGLSYHEIEQVSGLSQSAIATRLSRIRARLGDAVRGHDDIDSTILALANAAGSTEELMRTVAAELQQWAGCEAVGIRLRTGGGDPLFTTRGFPAQLVEMESHLCARDASEELLRDSQGRPVGIKTSS